MPRLTKTKKPEKRATDLKSNSMSFNRFDRIAPEKPGPTKIKKPEKYAIALRSKSVNFNRFDIIVPEEPFRLLDLPRELRDSVYEFAIAARPHFRYSPAPRANYHDWSDGSYFSLKGFVALLCVSPQVNKEVEQMFFRQMILQSEAGDLRRIRNIFALRVIYFDVFTQLYRDYPAGWPIRLVGQVKKVFGTNKYELRMESLDRRMGARDRKLPCGFCKPLEVDMKGLITKTNSKTGRGLVMDIWAVLEDEWVIWLR